jgi:hypothetical protein
MKTEFFWTDELVKEFMDKYNSIGDCITGIDPRGDKMAEFKEFKNPIVHSEKPTILTTDDGVDIKQGDTYYYVPKKTLAWVNATCNAIPQPKDSFNYFSTKQMADDFVLLNKPCLSVYDIMKESQDIFLNGVLTPIVTNWALIKLAKEKNENN